MRPSHIDAYRRLLILKHTIDFAYVFIRGENMKQRSPQLTDSEKEKLESDRQNEMNGILASVKRAGLWEYTTTAEKKFLSTSYSEMDMQALINASWSIEGAVVLLWALQLTEDFPDINEQANPQVLNRLVANDTGSVAEEFSLRLFHEIEKMRDLIELWHWRVNTRILIERDYDFQAGKSMEDPGYESLDDIVREIAVNAYSAGNIKELIDEDFVFKGQAFRELPGGLFREAHSLILERHRALNWLCGYAPDNNWEETPTDT